MKDVTILKPFRDRDAFNTAYTPGEKRRFDDDRAAALAARGLAEILIPSAPPQDAPPPQPEQAQQAEPQPEQAQQAEPQPESGQSAAKGSKVSHKKKPAPRTDKPSTPGLPLATD